jgi:hypothetical protein
MMARGHWTVGAASDRDIGVSDADFRTIRGATNFKIDGAVPCWWSWNPMRSTLLLRASIA